MRAKHLMLLFRTCWQGTQNSTFWQLIIEDLGNPVILKQLRQRNVPLKTNRDYTMGEVEGAPQEYGLELDARAAYDWLIAKKGTVVITIMHNGSGIISGMTHLLLSLWSAVSPDRITLTGHSLGKIPLRIVLFLILICNYRDGSGDHIGP